MIPFISGAIFMAHAIVSLLFLKFWRRTGDRVFGWFSAAFAVLAFERLLPGSDVSESVTPPAYAARLAAYVLIIAAVIDRNRRMRD